MATKNSINNKTGSLSIDPGSSGDSYVQFNINTTGEFRIGVDDTDSDAFKFSQGSALGSNDFLTISAAGEVLNPLTPAFGMQGADASNVTGDSGTFYTITTGTEYFDQNSDFDGTSTFTAPITGKYYFNICITCDGITSAQIYGQSRLTTSNRIYACDIKNSGAMRDANNAFTHRFSVIADMDAADTAYMQIYVYSIAGSNVVDVVGSGTFFSGYLVG